MKNTIYAGVIGVCILLAAVMFFWTRGGGSGLDDLPDSEMTWVKCLKCNQSYEMGMKQYLKEANAKAIANPSAPLILLACRECNKESIVKARKCEKCGEVFREGSVPNDHPDRCPKCKHSATEAKRAARQQG
jgi:predicted Zn-ribbon and HTH transcriptional regulator